MGLFIGSTDICVPGGLNVGAGEVQLASVGDKQTYPCGTGLCFTFDESEICLPWAGIMPDGNALDWTFEIEFKAPTDWDPPGSSDYLTLFENRSACDGVRTETNKRFAVTAKKNFGPYTAAEFYLVNSLGSGATFNPGPGEVELGDWCKLTLDYTALDPNPLGDWENITDGLNDKVPGATGGAWASFVASDVLVLGSGTQWTTLRFVGEMRNVKLTVDGVVVAHWPIQGYIRADGTVLDISGNGHHGTVNLLGGGSIGACP